MTNGDFAFFTYGSSRSSRTDQPWDRYVDDPQQIPYRRKAFYGVKQVRVPSNWCDLIETYNILQFCLW